MDWQPIETAPKDGTQVDLWAVRWKFSDRKTGKTERETRRWAEASYGQQGWTASYPNSASVFIVEYDDWVVTHWQPLPAPPSP